MNNMLPDANHVVFVVFATLDKHENDHSNIRAGYSLNFIQHGCMLINSWVEANLLRFDLSYSTASAVQDSLSRHSMRA